jgi:hypothetical protein
MKKARVALVCGVALLLLLPVSAAAAAYAPQLVVTPASPGSGTAGVTIAVLGTSGQEATARSVVYLPLGYRTRRPAAGVLIGKASMTAVTPAGGLTTLSGTVTAAAAADFANSACAAGFEAVWVLEVLRNRTLIKIPLLVAPPPAAAATFAAATITVCWPAPGATAVRGLLPTSLTFALGSSALTAPPAAGTYRWRAQLTPYTAGAGGGENVAGTVEAQSLVLTPAALRLSAKLTMRRTPVDVKVTRTVNGRPVTVVEHRVLVTRYASLTGTATEGDAGLEGAIVDVLGASSPTKLRGLTQATADARGAFATLIQINTTAKTVYFSAQLELAVRDRGTAACVASFGATVPCVSSSSGVLSLTTPVVRLATGR